MHGKFDGLGRFADPSLLILTSLSDGPKHGYAMMTDIAAFSGVGMEPGALYGALSRLERRGWIRPLAAAERRRRCRSPPARRSWPSNCGRCSRSSASAASAPPPPEPVMTPALADRLSRAVVGCYPRRWKQRYAAELLDVLDQHHAGPRTVLSLAGGTLSTHLDPDYRMQMPRLSRDARQAVVITAAVIVALPAFVILPMIPRAIRESRWEPSGSDSVAAIAFSRDQRIVVSANGGPPWEATSTLWDVTGQARPRLLSVFEGGSPATISPDGATVAANAFGGRAQAALWNVTRPRHPARLAVLSAGLSGALWGEAFSPDGRILAAASSTGLVLWDVADPARPRLLRSLAAAPLPVDNHGPPVPFGVTQGDLVFSPDGRMLASVSGRNQVTVWDVARPARAARMATSPARATTSRRSRSPPAGTCSPA